MSQRTCQLLDLLWMEAEPSFMRFVIRNGGIGWARSQPVDEHHLFGGTSRKNRKANLLYVAHPIHIEWGHDHPPEFRVTCMYRQKQLGLADWSVWDECFGGRPGRVRGLIESRPLTGVFEKWRMELLTT